MLLSNDFAPANPLLQLSNFIDVDIGTKHRLVAFMHPLNVNLFQFLCYSFVDTLAVNFCTDANKIL